MRKFLLLLLVLLFIAGVFVYFFIPAQLPVSKASLLNINGKLIHRCLIDTALLQKMAIAAKAQAAGNRLTVDEATFQFNEQLTDNIAVPINYKNVTADSYMSIVNVNKDSSGIEWRTRINTGNNPLRKIKLYFLAKEMQSRMGKVLQMVQDFAAKPENIYGIAVSRARVNDTLLISTKSRTSSYPSPNEYYALISQLETYAAAQGARAVNYPMLHVDRIDAAQYEIMVALPLNKAIPNKGPLIFKKMVAGNILTSEVRGGIKNIEYGFLQLGNYASDYSLVSPAISFQSLITNRLTEPDSSKWVTKLYMPVF